MFKSKIAKKLSITLGVCLIIFSIIIGTLFAIIFKENTINNQKQQLIIKAQSMATSLSGYMGKGNSSMYFGAYMNFIEDIADGNVWVVDTNSNLVTGKKHMGMHENIQYNDLPANADNIINNVLSGKTVFSNDFNNLLDKPSLTIGTPIINNGQILGALLLHTPVDGLNSAIFNGILMLIISIIVALLIGILLTSFFAVAFSKPLNTMKANALKLIDKDYQVRNAITQDDEIGELAQVMDVLAKRLDDSSKESQKLEHLRQTFITNVSHELKTPVTVIRGSIEAIADGTITDYEKIRNYCQNMLKESIFLQRLINDLLDLSKLQSIDFVINKSDVVLNDLISDIVRNSIHLSKSKNIQFECDLSILSNKLFVINADYDRIRQLIMIIIDNAIKFSYDNSTIKLAFHDNTLTVTDFGCGIADAEINTIFERFQRNRNEQNKQGSGLGLAIANEIALRHDITLKATSQNGETCFSIIFNNIKSIESPL